MEKGPSINALPLTEADTHAKLVNPAIYSRGWTEDHIKREESTGAVEIIAGKARRRSKGRTDLTLRVIVTAETQPVAVAVIEVKRDTLPPGKGLTQAKGYAKAARLNVPFVFSTNGHMSKAGALDTVKHHAFYGREKENLIYPIGLANLILHGIDDPHIWHGNALTGHEVYGGLFKDAPNAFDVILTNPPFGGKENAKSIVGFDYATGATEVLFLQAIVRSLAPNGRCGVVLPEGVLFRTNQEAFTKTKKKLLEECDLWCIVSLPGGVFTAAGAGVKTNLLFFTKGKATEKIWYYDLSDRKVGKKTPLTVADFKEFFELLPKRSDSEKSWSVDFTARRRQATEDAKPHRKTEAEKKAEASSLKMKLSALKKEKPRNKEAIEQAKAEYKEATKAAKLAAKKAQDIEDAVYDLKAVNPNKKPIIDTRTPAEIMLVRTMRASLGATGPPRASNASSRRIPMPGVKGAPRAALITAALVSRRRRLRREPIGYSMCDCAVPATRVWERCTACNKAHQNATAYEANTGYRPVPQRFSRQ